MRKRILVLFLIFVIVFTASGCDLMEMLFGENESWFYDPDYTGPTEFQQYEIRPVEEIIKEGITPEDVFALYDALALKAAKAYLSSVDSTTIKKKIDKMSAQFDALTPGTYPAKSKYIYNAYYLYKDSALVSNGWFNDEDGLYYHPEVSVKNVYFVDFPVNLSDGDHYRRFEMIRFYVSKARMKNCFEAFGISTFEVTKTFIDSEISTYGEDWRFFVSPDIGKQVYEPFIFDRAVIQNANEEQLWALYNLVDNIDKINFLGIDPYIYEQEK